MDQGRASRMREPRAEVGARSSEHNRVKNNNGGNNGTLLHGVVKPGAAPVCSVATHEYISNGRNYDSREMLDSE